VPGRPLRILVVDDDPAMVGAINALVGTEGHQVITAYDGLTAVRRFREEHPDLVLLDLPMPGPDGITAVSRRVDRTEATALGGPVMFAGISLDPGRHDARVGETPLVLTPTEYRLLETLARGGGGRGPHPRLARA